MMFSYYLEKNENSYLLKILFVFTLFIVGIISNGYSAIFISTIEELQLIGSSPAYPLNGEYILTQDIDASDTINWNDRAGFKPIGTFTGKFYGNGHAVFNLYINRPTESNVGLFGHTGAGAEITYLRVVNAEIVGQNKVGIVVGYNQGGSIEDCHSSGTVSGSHYVGGITGDNRDVGYVIHTYSSATVSGDSYLGGIAGANRNLVTRSFFEGTVNGTTSYIGGVVGENRGTINNSYSTGAVSGTSYIGGLVGSNRDTVTNCYSTGLVSASGTYYGGLLGHNTATVSDSYWDKDTSGQSSSAGGTGKTTSEMKQQSTFNNWDFNNIWGIVEGVTYPYFQWQTEYVVPYVIGLTQASATAEITASGLTVGSISQQCSNTVPAGRVITQNPTSGIRVPAGSPVNLVISTGPCNTIVPDVVGMAQSSAETAITNASLIVGTVTQQCDNSVPAGIVISQTPSAGTPVTGGTPVNIVVSSGPCTEGEGIVEGTPEGTPEGEGIVEGT
ncbi:MAG TPA: PASTA domain-containing protein, partial [Candidatus Hydrogenedens sp.]|nr:PASTA domain-containing protein [Candidatus Hydrogenedens sp.]